MTPQCTDYTNLLEGLRLLSPLYTKTQIYNFKSRDAKNRFAVLTFLRFLVLIIRKKSTNIYLQKQYIDIQT